MQKAVGKRGLAVVNVGNDAEISNMCGVHCFSKSEHNRIATI
jgi:hypothetical protein